MGLLITTKDWSAFRPHHIFTGVGNKVTRNVRRETDLPKDHKVKWGWARLGVPQLEPGVICCYDGFRQNPGSWTRGSHFVCVMLTEPQPQKKPQSLLLCSLTHFLPSFLLPPPPLLVKPAPQLQPPSFLPPFTLLAKSSLLAYIPCLGKKMNQHIVGL